MPSKTRAWRLLRSPAAWYAYGPALIGAATGATLALKPGILLTPLYFVAVIVTAWFGGLGPGLVTALIATQAINFFFLPPQYTFTFDLAELPQLLAFLLIAGLVSWWTSQRRRIQNELQKSEFRYRNIFEAMAVSFWDLDFTGVGNLLRKWKASGVTDLRRYLAENPGLVREAMKATIALDVNEKSVQLFGGKSRAELLGPSDRYWPPQSDWVYLESVIAAVGGKPYFEAECQMRKANGELFDALFTVSFPTGAVGRGRILVGIIDMTERNRAIVDLQRTQAELAHAVRVATLGELSASIAHEVNQPLAAIVTNGEAGLRWLARETPDVGEVRRAMGRMIVDGKRAAEIIQRIRALATKRKSERARLSANDVVADAAALVGKEAAIHGIAVRLDLDAAAPEIEADRVQVQQVVVNLLVNAIQAMAPSTTGGRDVIVRTRRAGGTLAIEVEDSGPGIAPDVGMRVFDAFYSTKASGMGMGLSICRTIVEAHGGQITFANKPETGAVFKLTLPMESPQA
jgi:signal transduction histidine kinase